MDRAQFDEIMSYLRDMRWTLNLFYWGMTYKWWFGDGSTSDTCICNCTTS